MYTKNLVRVPTSVTAVYSNEKNIVTFIGPAGCRSLKLILKVKLMPAFGAIEVTSQFSGYAFYKQKKRKKAMRNTLVALLKQLSLESLSSVYRKLKFVGMGYKSLDILNLKNRLFLFKLGLSHPLYCRAPSQIRMACLKFTKLFIHGDCYQYVTQISSNIRGCKLPEPYKGKGILYMDEKITLKVGKKI